MRTWPSRARALAGSVSRRAARLFDEVLVYIAVGMAGPCWLMALAGTVGHEVPPRYFWVTFAIGTILGLALVLALRSDRLWRRLLDDRPALAKWLCERDLFRARLTLAYVLGIPLLAISVVIDVGASDLFWPYLLAFMSCCTILNASFILEGRVHEHAMRHVLLPPRADGGEGG
jgi:hypothetical protein